MLGYSNPRDAIATHCKSDGAVNRDVIDSIGRKQSMKFITEGNVYRLITSSKQPKAEKFEHWLFDEVVPSIRKKGFYGYVDRTKKPDFIDRFYKNAVLTPPTHFSVITELYIRLYSLLEKAGYSIPDKGMDGKTMCPDISIGKCFSVFLREHNSDLWNKHRTYKHQFPDGRIIDAYMYPIEAIPMYIRYINEKWIPEKAESYFKKKDPVALDYLPKLINKFKKDA